MNNANVIYIGGIGRSGSSLLDLLISSCPEVTSVGEAFRFGEITKKDSLCSCGAPIKDCSYWRPILDNNIKIINRQNVWNYIKIFLFTSVVPKRIKFKKKDNSEKFYKTVSRKRYILDSSKDLARLIELDNNKDIDVKCIFLIRDGRKVAESFNSKKEGKPKNYYFSLLKWFLVNHLYTKILEKRKIKHVKIRYEEFVANPDFHTKRLEKFLGIKIPKDYVKKVKKQERHTLGGNRISKSPNLKKFQGIKKEGNTIYKKNVPKPIHKLVQNKLHRWEK